jgi:hypothetical protein
MLAAVFAAAALCNPVGVPPKRRITARRALRGAMFGSLARKRARRHRAARYRR